MIEGWENRLLEAIDKAIAAGRSQRGIGEAADLGPNFVSQFRSGTRVPRLGSLIKLANVLDVSLRSILFGDEVSAEDEEILELLKMMSDKSRRGFLEMLRGMSDHEEPGLPGGAGKAAAPTDVEKS